MHKIYNLHLFNGHRASCLWFITHTKPKKNENIILCPPIKSYLFSYGYGFFPKLRVYYAFIVHQVQKNTFFE
jgi:hypothetical protein